MEIRTGPSPGLVSLIYWLEIGHAKFWGKYAVPLPRPALGASPRRATDRAASCDRAFPVDGISIK